MCEPSKISPDVGIPPPNTQYVAYPYPVPIVPPNYWNYLVCQGQQLNTACIENERLRNQLQQKQMAEEAYSKSLTVADNCICTTGKRGALLPILNRTVEWSAHITPLPPLKDAPFYIVRLSQSNQLLRLSEAEFFNDVKLISKLQEINGVEVTIRKSPKATAMLLRQAIQKKMNIGTASIYAGWTAQGGDAYHFMAFNPFSAHCKYEGTVPGALPPTSPAAAELAIRRWLPAFSLIQDGFAYWFIMIWFHMAFLYSLLEGLGFRPSLGLYIFCDRPDCLAYLNRLLCWYGDQTLSLDTPPTLFNDELLRRKDQVMVIEDSYRTKNAKHNAAVIEEMLVSHKLLWKNGGEFQYLPVQALPTVLASTVSVLACDPNLIILDLPANLFLPEQFQDNSLPAASLAEYLMVFANYTSEHSAQLRTYIEAPQNEAWNLAEGTLSEACITTLEIMLGLHRFLEDFYATYSCNTAIPSIDELIPKLLSVLHETSNKVELAGCLDSQFVAVARSMIQHKQLDVWPLAERHAAPENTAVVYVDKECLYFTSTALKQVCGQLEQSRPIVLRTLAGAGLI